MLLLIEIDSQDAILEHEEQVVGRNRLTIMSSSFRVSRGLADINDIAVREASRAPVQDSWILVHRTTSSQATQASTMCDFHSSNESGSTILGRVDSGM
jgi:hypothetical protein